MQEENLERLPNLPSSAWSKALEVYKVVCNFECIMILTYCLRVLPTQWTFADLQTCSGSVEEQTLRKHLRLLVNVKLIHMEKIGKINHYTLNHDRLELINGSAARLL